MNKVLKTILFFNPVAAAPAGPSYETPAYTNAGGTGDRHTIITATTDLTGIGSASELVNGGLFNSFYFNVQAAAGKEIKFYFTTQRLITEAKYYQSGTQAQGTWKWQGSDDGSTWADIGASFALGGATTQTITTLSANATGYKYYRLLGVSGNTSSGPYVFEMEFKIGNPI